MNNYEKAFKLLKEGVAERHHAFRDTGYLVLNLGGPYTGYISPDDSHVEVAKNSSHVSYGDIDLEKMMVIDASNRVGYVYHIKKWERTEAKCVAERPCIW